VVKACLQVLLQRREVNRGCNKPDDGRVASLVRCLLRCFSYPRRPQITAGGAV
jgi:hypothetical protein